MRRGRGLAALAPVVFLLWPLCGAAAEHGAVERPKAPEAGPGRQPPTPEQLAERQKQMKANLERQAEFLSATAKGFEARRDELKAMAAKDTLAVNPPFPQMIGSRDARGGPGAAMRAAMGRHPGGPGPEAGTPRPGTFDVANSDDLKKAIAKALDAYAAALPLFDEQKKAIDDQLKQAEGGAQPDPAAMRDRMAATRDLMTKFNKAQTAVGDAEAALQLLQTKAWLDVAKDKVADDQAKAAAAKALEALDKYIALKAQLDDLEQKIDKEAAALQEGLGQLLPALMPGRGGREGQGPRGGPERPKADTPPGPRGAEPK